MAWIYHNATLWLISLSSDGSNWITIADKNLWATQVWNSWDALSEANAGKYYQWGNNYGFPFTWSVTTSSSQVNAQNYWPWNYYSSSTFITRSSSPYRWDSTDNWNLWWWDTWTNAAMQWPCAEWYHIPLNAEWQSVKSVWTTLGGGSSAGTNFWIALKLPFAWSRGLFYADISQQGTRGIYWASSRYDWNFAYAIDFEASDISQNTVARANGCSVRPFKNEAVIPDYNDVWDTLYWDELPDRPIPPEPPVPVKKLKWLMNKWNFYYFDEAPTHASSVTLNESSITLTEVWQTYQLTATVSPSDAVEKKVHWSSSDITVATVTQTGLVTCVTPGECTITATCDWVSATCSVSAIIEAYIEFLLVWWGWWGWNINKASWWWWAWWLLHCCDYLITSWQYCVVVWDWWWTWAWYSQTEWFNWCNSTFDWITAYWWWGWAGTSWYNYWQNWWSWWWWGWCAWWTWCAWQWHNWGCWAWYSSSSSGWWGWWWAGSNWCNWQRTYWWLWWTWCTLNISWVSYTYSKGWDGSACLGSCWTPGNWVNYWDWWWWACWCNWYCWHSWIFIARYPTACWYSIIWWCKYTCGDYTIHCFTSDWTLTVVWPSEQILLENWNNILLENWNNLMTE